MGIVSIVTDQAGQVGFNPRVIKIITTDNLATITAAGYLNAVSLEGYYILPTDELHVWYGYASAVSPGTFAIFTPSISNGVITLVQWASPGSVAIPTVAGDFTIFSNTSGAMEDLGYSPTNAAKTKVVMLDAAPTINHVAKFTSANGTIGDGGVLGTAAAKAASDNSKATLASINAAPTSGHVAAFTDNVGTIGDGGVLGTAAAKAASDNALPSLSSVNGATVIDHLASFNDIVGTVEDSGIAKTAVQLSSNILANKTADIGGAGAGPISVVVAGLTASSIITATIASSSNTVAVGKCIATVTGFDITFTGDPGAACVVNYVAFIAAQ